MSRLNLFVVVLVLSGCVNMPRPADGPAGVEPPAKWGKGGVSDGSPDGWLATFDDKVLHDLVAEAVEYNHDLKAAGARLRQAAANVQVAGADIWPQLSLSGGATRSKRNFIGFGALGGGRGSGVVSSRSTTYEPLLNFGWEVDIWGESSDRRKAAIADALGADALYRFARFSLAANVAIGWFDAIETHLQLQLAEQTAKSFEYNLGIIDRRYGTGTAQALDLRLVRANVATAHANVALRERQRDLALRSLEILLGRYPSAELRLAEKLPELAVSVPAGLPIQLLERRPDLIAAFKEVEAARKHARADQKARLPNFTLSASGGTRSEELGDALDNSFSIWTLAASVVQPVFQGGRLRAAGERSRAAWEESLERYRTRVLEAFRDVESALANEAYLRKQVERLAEAATEAGAAERLAWDRYEGGTADITTVLDAQRRAFEARSSHIELQSAYMINRVDLYLALGGDFELKDQAEDMPEEVAQ